MDKKCKLRRMSLKEYNAWIRTKEARKASLPKFFDGGVERTKNVLRGKARQSSVDKWESFGARHGAQYCKNPTSKRRYALKNWGYSVSKRPKEKNTTK